MSKQIELSLSSNYVSHWGTWEAVREIIQNAVDSEFYKIDFSLLDKELSEETGELQISSFAGPIPTNCLLLGNTSKADNNSAIGQFGEGFKLALLVLTRLGHQVSVKNGLDHWDCTLQHSKIFDDTCLTINIEENYYQENKDTVTFYIKNLPIDFIDTLEHNFLFNLQFDTIKGTVATFEKSCCFEPLIDNDPALYVGGLFVCKLNKPNNKFRYSYNFAPNILKLDRDRKSIESFEFSWEVAKLLKCTGNIELLASLVSNDHYSDLKGYTSHHTYYGTHHENINKKLAIQAWEEFINKHGKKAFPIDCSLDHNKKRVLMSNVFRSGYQPVEVNTAFFTMLKESIPELNFDLVYEIDMYKFLNEFINQYQEILPEEPLNKLVTLKDDFKILKGIEDEDSE